MLIVRLLSKLLLKFSIEGKENMPVERGPLIIVSNHFSWFEAPLVAVHFPTPPVFFMAAELLEQSRILRFLIQQVDAISVQRGRVDRAALGEALWRLKAGQNLLIFPEGGIDPDLQEQVALGRPISLSEGQNSRLSGQLIPARPGTAYLAVQSGVPILPVAFLGTEKVQANIRLWRRTPVTMRIGHAFGPLEMEPKLHGPARRARLDQYTTDIMRHIADLLPPENRGPYA